MGRLSTHVLDTMHGRPAKGVRVTLDRLDGGTPHRVAEALTNSDGRTDQPLMAGDSYRPGSYVLSFDVRGYYRALGVASPFLDVVRLHFDAAEPDGAYHVPLVVTPYSYSTYRGS